MTTKKSGKGMAVMAAMAPGLFCLIGSAVGLAIVSGGGSFLRLLEELISYSGIWGTMLILSAPLVCTASGVLLYKSARGRAVPAAMVVFLSVLPWLLGLVGSYVGLSHARGAMEVVAPSQMTDAMAMGISISGGTTWLGALLSAALLLGVALAYTFGAKGTGISSRSSALFVAGIFAAALSLAAITSFGAGSTTTLSMETLDSAAPDMRLALLAKGASRLHSWQSLRVFGSLALLLPLGFMAFRAFKRSAPSGGRIVRASLALMLGVLPFVANLAMSLHEERLMKAATKPYWEEVDEFTPIQVPTNRGNPINTPHAHVLPDKIVPWRGKPCELGSPGDPQARNALTSSLKALLDCDISASRSLAEILGVEMGEFSCNHFGHDEFLDWVPRNRKRKKETPPADKVLKRPSLNLAFDMRVPGKKVRAIFDAAKNAGAKRVVLSVSKSNEPIDPEAQALFGWTPYFSHLLQPDAVEIPILLETALPLGCEGSNQARFSAVVGSGKEVQVDPLPGKLDGNDPFTLGPKDDIPPETDNLYGGNEITSIICLTMESDATITDLATAAQRALKNGHSVVALTSP